MEDLPKRSLLSPKSNVGAKRRQPGRQRESAVNLRKFAQHQNAFRQSQHDVSRSPSLFGSEPQRASPRVEKENVPSPSEGKKECTEQLSSPQLERPSVRSPLSPLTSPSGNLSGNPGSPFIAVESEEVAHSEIFSSPGVENGARVKIVPHVEEDEEKEESTTFIRTRLRVQNEKGEEVREEHRKGRTRKAVTAPRGRSGSQCFVEKLSEPATKYLSPVPSDCSPRPNMSFEDLLTFAGHLPGRSPRLGSPAGSPMAMHQLPHPLQSPTIARDGEGESSVQRVPQTPTLSKKLGIEYDVYNFTHSERSEYHFEYELPECAEHKQWDLFESSRETWDLWLQYHGAKLRDLIMCGIPDRHRVWAWKRLMHATSSLSVAYGADYDSLAMQEGHPDATRQIKLDLDRTFSTHKMFLEDNKQVEMFQILKAYSVHNPAVGYCQGMSYVVAVLMMYMNNADAFASFRYIVDEQGFNMYYSQTMSGLLTDCDLFQKVMDYRMPMLAAHLRRHHVDTVIFITSWFLTFFTGLPRWSAVLLFFDMFFAEGKKSLFRFALALLIKMEPHLLHFDGIHTILPFIQRPPAWILDPVSLSDIARRLPIEAIVSRATEAECVKDLTTLVTQTPQPPRRRVLRKQVEEVDTSLWTRLLSAFTTSEISNVQRQQTHARAAAMSARLPTRINRRTGGGKRKQAPTTKGPVKRLQGAGVRESQTVYCAAVPQYIGTSGKMPADAKERSEDGVFLSHSSPGQTGRRQRSQTFSGSQTPSHIRSVEMQCELLEAIRSSPVHFQSSPVSQCTPGQAPYTPAHLERNEGNMRALREFSTPVRINERLYRSASFSDRRTFSPASPVGLSCSEALEMCEFSYHDNLFK